MIDFVITLTDRSRSEEAYELSIREKALFYYLNRKQFDVIFYRVKPVKEAAFRRAIVRTFAKYGIEFKLYTVSDWYDKVVYPSYRKDAERRERGGCAQ